MTFRYTIEFGDYECFYNILRGFFTDVLDDDQLEEVFIQN
jgi:hypothetical protein